MPVPEPDPKPEAGWKAELVLEPDPKLEAEAEAEPDAAPEPSEPEADPADEALKKAATVCWRLGGFSPVTSVEMSMLMVS